MSLTKVTYSMISGALWNPVDYGADPSGVANSTTAIQSAIDAVGAAGGGVLFFPPGVYKVTELTCYTNNVAMYGYGAQLYGTDKDAVILRVRGNDIHIEGFEMTQNVTTVAEWSTKSGRAIYLEPDGSQVGCRRVFIQSVYAHNIALITISGDRCEDVKVIGCTVENCGGAGILMNATEGECLISGNHVYNVGDDGIMCVPVAASGFATLNGGKYNGGQVIGNTVDKGGNIFGLRGTLVNGYPAGAAGIKVGGERVIVDSNIVTNSGAGAIFVTAENGYPANGVTISNNRLYNTLYYSNGVGYQLIRIPDTAPGTIANDIQIIDNVIDTSTYGVFAPSATNMIVRGNTLRNLAIGILTNGAYITIDSNYGRDFDIGLPFADPGTFPTANRAPVSNDNGASFLTITNNYFDSGYGLNTGTVVRWLSSDTVVFNNVFRNFQYDAVNLQPYPFAGWQRNFSNSTTTNVGKANGANVLALYDGVSTPATVPTVAQLYVDTADGDLKVLFGDGVIKTIVTDV